MLLLQFCCMYATKQFHVIFLTCANICMLKSRFFNEWYSSTAFSKGWTQGIRGKKTQIIMKKKDTPLLTVKHIMTEHATLCIFVHIFYNKSQNILQAWLFAQNLSTTQ